MRSFLLFLHIVGAAGWLGGGLFAFQTYTQVARMGPPAAGDALKELDKRGTMYFGITSGLVLLSGIALVLTSDAFGWTDGFVLIGLGAFILSGVIQSLVGKKANQGLNEAATTGNGIEPAVRSWQFGSVWDLVILLVVVWAMVTKLGA
jgi:putative copper export protein